MTTFYCHRFETHPTWRARSSYLYPLGTGGPSYTPSHWVSFFDASYTRSATVEVFDLASTRDLFRCFKLTELQSINSLLLLPLRTERTENIDTNNLSIVTCVSVAAETCLPSRCVAINVSSGSTILAFRRHDTIHFDGEYGGSSSEMWDQQILRYYLLSHPRKW
jgi:hypothetical protein